MRTPNLARLETRRDAHRHRRTNRDLSHEFEAQLFKVRVSNPRIMPCLKLKMTLKCQSPRVWAYSGLKSKLLAIAQDAPQSFSAEYSGEIAASFSGRSVS